MTDSQLDQLVNKQVLQSQSRLRYWQDEANNATIEYNNTVTNTQQQRNTELNGLIQERKRWRVINMAHSNEYVSDEYKIDLNKIEQQRQEQKEQIKANTAATLDAYTNLHQAIVDKTDPIKLGYTHVRLQNKQDSENELKKQIDVAQQRYYNAKQHCDELLDAVELKEKELKDKQAEAHQLQQEIDECEKQLNTPTQPIDNSEAESQILQLDAYISGIQDEKSKFAEFYNEYIERRNKCDLIMDTACKTYNQAFPKTPRVAKRPHTSTTNQSNIHTNTSQSNLSYPAYNPVNVPLSSSTAIQSGQQKLKQPKHEANEFVRITQAINPRHPYNTYSYQNTAIQTNDAPTKPMHHTTPSNITVIDSKSWHADQYAKQSYQPTNNTSHLRHLTLMGS